MTLADNGFSRGTKLNKTPRRQNRRAKTDLGIQRLQPNDLPVIISGVKEFRRLGTDVMFIRHRSWGPTRMAGARPNTKLKRSIQRP